MDVSAGRKPPWGYFSWARTQEALVRVLLDELDLYKFGIMLSLYTGIRLGELCTLRWEDIYIEAATLKVSARSGIFRYPNLLLT